MSSAERLALAEHADPVLSVVAQCRLLKVVRSMLYYRPAPANPDDLAVVRRMDELHLASPQSIAFFSAAATERLCSGVTKRTASAAPMRAKRRLFRRRIFITVLIIDGQVPYLDNAEL